MDQPPIDGVFTGLCGPVEVPRAPADGRTMPCAYCGDRRQWPDGFPSPSFAQCWLCFWNRHCEASHPPKKRLRFRIWREAVT